jgi:DNA-binding MarR family transcriptional regulator
LVTPHQEASPAASAGPATDLVNALASLSRVLVGATARALSQLEVEVTLPQFRTLVVLASRGPQRTIDLAQELGVQSSTVTRTCDRLARRGLLRRGQRAGGDRRVVWIVLTEAGKELVGEAMHRRRAELSELVASVPLVDAAVGGVLDALVEAAGEEPDPRWWERWSRSTEFDAS